MTTKAEFRKMVADEGVPAAYRALMRVLDDPRASPTALASAGRTMFEIAGLTKAPEDDQAKEPHEMTLEEIQSRLALLRREAADRAIPILEGVSARRRDPQPETSPAATAPSGVFG